MTDDENHSGRGMADARISEPNDSVLRYSVDETESLSDGVLAAYAVLGEIDDDLPPVTELTPLYETLEVTVLDDLFKARDGSVRLQFSHEGYDVTVLGSEIVFEKGESIPT